MGIVEYKKDVKKLEEKRIELSDEISEKLGFAVSIRMTVFDSIAFQVFRYRHLKRCAEHFGIKGDVQYDEGEESHHFTIEGRFEGHKAEVVCYMLDEDCEEHERSMSNESI